MQTVQAMLKVKNRTAGFTLIELCVVIIILGVVIGVVATGYQSWQKKVEVETNQERIATISERIYDYKKIHGHYPQPASLTIARGDEHYGYSQNTAGVAVPAAGSGTDGFYAQSGVSGRTVQIGALPFRELNIPEEESYDVYGSRIIYAITAAATQDNFKENLGGIQIKNEAGQDLFNDNFPGVFAVFSPGRNRLGGFSMAGKEVKPCTGSTADMANCDFLTGATDANFNSNSYSEASGANEFDDIIAFNRLPAQESQWRRGLIDKGEDSNDLIDMSESKIYVGAQKKVEASDGKLSILYSGENEAFDGSLYVRGALRTKEVCDASGTDCFTVSNIEQTCPAGEYVIGFYSGQPQCGPVYFGCPDGERITGITATGTPVCQIAPLSPEDGACGSAHNQTLGAAPSGDTALCARGDSSIVNGTGPWSWSCNGINGGTNVSCSAQKEEPPINGECVNYSSPLETAPTSLCTSGTASSVSGSGPWSWTCQGEGPGHTDARCSASRRVVDPPVCECGPGNCPTTTAGACGPMHESPGWIGPPSPNPPGGTGPDGQYCSGGVTSYVSMFSPSPGVETYTWTCGTGATQVDCRSLPQTN